MKKGRLIGTDEANEQLSFTIKGADTVKSNFL